jgi:hypothetical protein
MIHNIEDPVMTLLKSMFSSAQKISAGILAGITSYFAPISVTVVCVCLFIIVDVILGYKVSRKYGHK